MALEAEPPRRGGANDRVSRFGLGRRDFLRLGGMGGLTLGVAACGAGSSAGSSAASTTPRRGGTLHAALSGGGSDDTLNGINPENYVDFARILQLSEGLVQLDRNAIPQLWLAQEVTPNSSGDIWTVRVRDGITFHNGKDLTADDVIYSFQQIGDPANATPGFPLMAPVNVAGITKLDNLTVRIPCKTPFSTFFENLASYYFNIIPVGYGQRNPVGTGPFKYKSFVPGEQSTFVRNDDYWLHGLPYLDELIISDFADETSQINALLSGSADVIDFLSGTSIPVVKSGGGKIVMGHGGGWNPIFVRVDIPPFKDVRVRQALRLVVDRPQMLKTVFDGYGTIGNDVFGIWDPDYDHSLPQRHQDLDQAKFLLKQAGYENLSYQMVTDPSAQGQVEAAQVFAQQAKGAGVNVALNQITVDEMYGPNFLKWPAGQDAYEYQPYFVQVSLATLGTAPFNDTHFDDPTYNNLYRQALATTDSAKRTEIAHEMQQIDYTSGGNIISCFPPLIDGIAARVMGVEPARTGWPLGTFDFKNFWLA